jgi:hypothetical protein
MNLLLIVSRIHDRLPHLTDYPAVYVTVSSLSRNDDIEREIENVPLKAMLVKFGESVTNRGKVCPNIRRCLAIACKLLRGKFWLNERRTHGSSVQD